MNAAEVIQAEIDKRKQEIEALELSLRIISGKASVSVPSVAKEPEEKVAVERKAVGRVVGKKDSKLSGKCWLPKEDRELKELHKEGFTDSEIAEKLGRSTMSVSVRRTRIGAVAYNRVWKKGYAPYRSSKKRAVSGKKKQRDKGKRKVADGKPINTGYVPKRDGYRVPVYRVIERPSSDHKPWTKDEVEKLKDMHERGISDADISDTLGRSVIAVAQRRYKMGMSKGNLVARKESVSKGVAGKWKADNDYARWTKSEEQMLVGMAANGYTPKQIANRLRRSTPAVRVKMHSLKDRIKG